MDSSPTPQPTETPTPEPADSLNGNDPAGTDEATNDDDGSGGGGLSVGAIVGIVASCLAALGGGLTVAIKNNNFHCCNNA